MFLKCPECNVILDWNRTRTCPSGHIIQDVFDIPLCFSAAQMDVTKTADPLYPLRHAIGIAQEVSGAGLTFNAMLDRFFHIREAELKTDLAREKELITRRTVPAVNECIADASLMLGHLDKPFPPSSRLHIDIGCGMGFGLAASSNSYFGPNILGVDLSPHYLVMARTQLAEHGIQNPNLVCADICSGWPIPLEKYDIAFISMEGVLEHIKDVPAFFANVRKIASYPVVLYLTVPYRWTLNRESHFNIRFPSWLPRPWQDRYIAWRLGVEEIDHVEFYSMRSLRLMIEKYFRREAIVVELNSRQPLKSHYLRCLVYIEGPQSFS